MYHDASATPCGIHPIYTPLPNIQVATVVPPKAIDAHQGYFSPQCATLQDLHIYNTRQGDIGRLNQAAQLHRLLADNNPSWHRQQAQRNNHSARHTNPRSKVISTSCRHPQGGHKTTRQQQTQSRHPPYSAIKTPISELYIQRVVLVFLVSPVTPARRTGIFNYQLPISPWR